jgi:polysaccharide chain length determinant protein (PEP-CTERM system associated)
MDAFDIKKSLDIASRRKYWVLIPLLLSILGGFAYFLVAPKIYEAQTLILVQAQRVPEDFVRSIVVTSVPERVRTISEQVTSRTNLERIIKKYPVLLQNDEDLYLDDVVSELRSKIQIAVGKGGKGTGPMTFTIALQGQDPETVAKVTNDLASNFIAENLKIRESQALGTSIFLSDELESVEKRLEIKEEELKKYREKYMGALPEHLTTNLRILEGLGRQLDQRHDSLRDAQNRKILLQAQIAEQPRPTQGLAISPVGPQENFMDIQALRDQLAYLEARYTSIHPDIIRLKETIATLEQGSANKEANSVSEELSSELNRIDPRVKRQLMDIEQEIEIYRKQIEETKSVMSQYQKKVEETPKRQQELISLNRDYGNLHGLYNSLLNRKLEAEISVSMERKQQGEQFKIIDPAKSPTVPVEPDITKILIFILALGLGIGGGLTYFVEIMDTSFKTPEEVEKDLQMPVMMSIPISYTKQELRGHKLKQILKATSVGVGFALSAIGIVFATKGVNETIDSAKTFLSDLGVL